MPSVATLAGLLTSLEGGETLLLPNPRAARELLTAFDARQRGRGLPAWEPAPALAWSQWTSGLYSELIVSGAETRLLLNAAQEHSLWREIIADDPPAEALGSTDALAELASSAFRLAAAWNATGRIRSAVAGPLGNTDTRTFARWAEAFARRCSMQKLLAPALLEAALAQHIGAKAVTVAKTLQLVGFLKLTPAQESLLIALAAQGTEITRQTLTTEDRPTFHAAVSLESPAEELSFAARWLRQTLEAAQQAGQSPRIAVLLPGLAEERAEFEAVLRETLAPELQSVSEDLSSAPWEFSGGMPLSSLGLIADALELARWTLSPLPQTRVTALLLSPYLGSGAAREQAAQFDALVRKKENLLRPELTLGSLVSLLEKHGSTLAWPRHLATEVGRSGDLSKPRTYAEWMELLRVLIQATGWPNSEARELTAAEFEATRAWDGVLDLVSTLDFSGRRVAFATALEALERQARSTPLTPPATRAPVQIMAPAEAEGSLFDAVLFLRATDENWPAPERPHPLLPWTLQKDLAMPGTDPVRSAARAREFTSALLAASRTVLFSYARADANGHLRPSPLIAELIANLRLTEIDASKLLQPGPVTQPLDYDLIADDTPLPSLPKAEINGGAAVLKLQAACGFLAFAQLRLNASEPKGSALGLDAAESGTLVHRVLHIFWGQVKNQDTLASLSGAQRRDLLAGCIDQAIAEERRRLATEWDEAYIQLQRERLLRVLEPWLALELERSPFAVIATERDEVVTVGPLKLKVRMDRIDNILDAEGERLGELYIDYKTGASASPAQWTGERPDEPQLPLYTLLSEPGEVMGVAFAKVRSGEEMKYAGLQANPFMLGPKARKPQDLVTSIAEWERTMTQLAEEFAAGRAAVSPKQYPKTCAHCGQRLLCRLDPASLIALDDANDDAEEADV
jgi:probable DNA repair protein